MSNGYGNYSEEALELGTSYFFHGGSFVVEQLDCCCHWIVDMLVELPRSLKNHCGVCASSNLKVETFLKLICGSWPQSSSFFLPVALSCNEASAFP